MTLTLKEERKLIDKIQHGDDRALKKLYFSYYPLVSRLMTKYYLENFDRQDWIQEGLIVCYQTAMAYDLTVTRRFGGYFRANFSHHIFNLIRKSQRQKRQIWDKTYSFDLDWNEIKDDENLIIQDDHLLVEDWQPVIALLSDLELEELEKALGIKEAGKDYQTDSLHQVRARYRMRRKIMQNLF